jgi:hypothetical protein
MTRIGIDLDGVVYPFVDVFRLYAEHQERTTYGPVETWEFHKDWGHDTAWLHDTMFNGCTEGLLWWKGSPMAGALEGCWELAERGHELVYCTTRPDYAERATIGWLSRWGFPTADLVLTADKGAADIDVLLDDGRHNVAAARAAGKRGIVYHQRWNRHVPGPRTWGWSQFTYMMPKAAA